MWLFVPEPNSPYVPDTAGSGSESLSLAQEFDLWVLLSGKPTRLPSSQIEWTKVPWIARLSTTIWNPSRASCIAAEWISSLPVFHVREPASPGSASASKTSDGSGQKSGASRAKSGRRGSSPRTSPASYRLTVAEPSRKSSGTWARAGGLRNGTVFPRVPSVPRTSAIVSSCSLPTPTASQYGSSQNGINGVGGENERPSAGRPSLVSAARNGMLPTPTASDMKRALSEAEAGVKRHHGQSLHQRISQEMLPTPLAQSGRQVGGRNNSKSGRTLTEQARRLPTPMASDGGARGSTTFMRGNETLLGAARRLPTPRASDATKGSRSIPERDGCLVRWKHTLIAGHVDGDTWNNKPTNLVASCDACNHSRTQRAVKHCKRGHELTDENIYRRREGGRGCRRCIRMRWKRWWRKNRRRS